MPSDRWQRLEAVFAEAVERPANLRAEFLARSCGSDLAMRDEIVALLAAVDSSSDFLAAPALDVFARQISREGWSVQPGDHIASYRIEQRLGAGGMGEVWRARDERLGRDVAIKLLLPNPSDAGERVRALRYEARAAGMLNHTNVLTVYDIGEHGGAPYLVTECLDGESLRARLGAGAPLAVDAALDIALQVARGLGAAHERGIVHRDLKPENVFVGLDGRVKILDFGLAMSPHEPLSEGSAALAGGTAGYMSPEQVRREVVDRRADIFALGSVLYEMLAGRRPFQGDNRLATLNAVLTLVPEELSVVNPAVSPELSSIVRRCLAKAPDDRFATVADVASALESVVQERTPRSRPSLLALVRRPAVMVTGVCVLLTIAGVSWRWSVLAARARWARSVAAPEIQRLSGHGDTVEAFMLARRALDVLPEDRQAYQNWLDISIPATVLTEPPGAEVAIAAYRNPTTWFPLGTTPLESVLIPRSLFRIRISKPGFEAIEGSGSPPFVRYRLDPRGSVPAGMVRVVGGREPVRDGLIAEGDDFWIGRYEVTNREFKQFVERGGYSRRDYWREPFLVDGRSVSWESALGRFRDATGQPGPSTWRFGTFPEGQAEFPVGGVSWYEAAAYAVFAGKSLPTIHHWYRAAGLSRFLDILQVSNFDGAGPARVGSYAGLSRFGTYDMAGNVKEWCSTETNHGRFLLGGAWNESRDTFADYDAKDPFERAPGYGFRVAEYIRPLRPEVSAPVQIQALVRDARTQKPVSDEIFAVYRRLYAYDHTPLNVVVESIAETEAWSQQAVVFDAAYGGERMRAHLFLPKNASPPYQTVIFVPAGDAFILASSRELSLRWGESILRSGRAFLCPVYKGTYERATFGQTGSNSAREQQIAWSRDLGRSIDYLETRADIDRSRLALFGVSDGADAAVILSALEPRLKTAVFLGTGIEAQAAPEIDTINFAPRIRIPVLMLNGRYDYEAPFATSQHPLFVLLGSSPGDKRHALLESGHALARDEAVKEIFPWLDRYLGPVGAGPRGVAGSADRR